MTVGVVKPHTYQAKEADIAEILNDAKYYEENGQKKTHLGNMRQKKILGRPFVPISIFTSSSISTNKQVN